MSEDEGDGGTAGRIRDFTRRHGVIKMEACDRCGQAVGLGCLCPPAPFAEAVQHVIDVGMLSDVDVAQATGVPVETVSAWLQDDEEPSESEATRVNELSVIVERLADVVSADDIALWLRKPLRTLGDEQPVDLLARGDYRAISRLVAGLESPSAS